MKFRFAICCAFVSVVLFALGCQPEAVETNQAAATASAASQAEVEARSAKPSGSDSSASVPNDEVSLAVAKLKQEYEDFIKTAPPVMGSTLAPEVEDITKRMLELAVENPKSGGAFEALEFVTNIHSIGPKLFKAFGELQKHHVLNEAVGDICLKHSFNCAPGVEGLMLAVEKNATDRTVLAKTIYARSRLYYLSKVNQQQFKKGGPGVEQMKKMMPKETLDHIMNFQPKDDEARKLLNTLIDQYSDIEIDGQSMKDVAGEALRFLDEEAKR